MSLVNLQTIIKDVEKVIDVVKALLPIIAIVDPQVAGTALLIQQVITLAVPTYENIKASNPTGTPDDHKAALNTALSVGVQVAVSTGKIPAASGEAITSLIPSVTQAVTA